MLMAMRRASSLVSKLAVVRPAGLINVSERQTIVITHDEHASVSSAVQGGGKRRDPGITFRRSTEGRRHRNEDNASTEAVLDAVHSV
jgi:hypothetical protein